MRPGPVVFLNAAEARALEDGRRITLTHDLGRMCAPAEQ
jgi:hypothetical protein